MKQFLHVALFLISFQLMGQLTPKQELVIDSLKACINKAPHDTVKINAYNAWDNIIYVSNPKLDLELNQKIVAIAEENLKKESLTSSETKAFKKALSLGFNSLGIIFYNKGNNDKAIDYYLHSLKIREEIEDIKGIAATLNNVGIVYQDRGDYAKAIACYTRSLKINEKIGDKNGEANTLSNIGRIYLDQGDTTKAIDYQARCLKIKEAIGDKRGMATAYNNLGSIYSDQGNIAKAMEYFIRNLKMSEEIGDKNKIALALANIGFVYKKQGDNSKALDYLNRSLRMFEEMGNKKLVAFSMSNIGDIYKQKGEIEKAIGFYTKALAIAQDAGLVATTKAASQSLADSYKITGNYKEALKMYELYIKMRDSIFSENSQKEIIKQEIKYTYDKQKALDAKEYEKQKEVSEEREQKQKVISYATAGSLALVLVFTFFVFNRLRFSRKQNKIIAEQNFQIVESINYSKKIQNSLLPKIADMQKNIANLFVFYEPKDIVSGDFYYFSEFEKYTLLACVDCTGHGVPGGFMSTLGSLLLDKIVNSNALSPSEILNKLSDEIIRVLHQQDGGEIQDGMDLSICLIDRNNKNIEFCGARNGIIVVTDGQAKRYKADLFPVGGNYMKKGVPIDRKFKTQTIPISQNDWIYMYTDGFIEQVGEEEGIPMNYMQFENQLIAASKKQSPEEKNKLLQTEIDNWKGKHDRDDDILVIGFQIT